MALPALTVIMLVAIIAAIIAAIGGASASASACDSSALNANLSGPPPGLVQIYRDAAAASNLGADGPGVLAGINRVETNFGRNLAVSSAGAVGWMQFEPSTWALPGIGDGGDPMNAHDAIFAAARYLARSGAPGDWYGAIFSYNHADWYVQEVVGYARQYGAKLADVGFGRRAPAPPSTAPRAADGGCSPAPGGTLTPGEAATALPDGTVSIPAGAPDAVKRMIAAGNQITMLPYVWGGHHWVGSSTSGYDCSSSVAYLLYAAGFLPDGKAGFTGGVFYDSYLAADFVPGLALTTGRLQAGRGHLVTLWSSGEHVMMEVAGMLWDDSGTARNSARPDGSNIPTWRRPFSAPGGFTPSHPEGL